MKKTAYIKDKNGKFAGSIGSGRDDTPQCAPLRPVIIAKETIAQPRLSDIDPRVATARTLTPLLSEDGVSPKKHHYPFTPITVQDSRVVPQDAADNPLGQLVARFKHARPCPRKIKNSQTGEIIWQCGNDVPEMRAMRGGDDQYCYDCRGYDKVVANSNRHGFEMSMNRMEYTQWRRSQDRKCFYCGIAEKDVHKLEARGSQGNKPYVESLGTDRWDSSRPYEIDNIVLACQLCNQMKSETHGDEFMQVLNREGLAKLRQDKVEAYKFDHQDCCPGV